MKHYSFVNLLAAVIVITGLFVSVPTPAIASAEVFTAETQISPTDGLTRLFINWSPLFDSRGTASKLNLTITIPAGLGLYHIKDCPVSTGCLFEMALELTGQPSAGTSFELITSTPGDYEIVVAWEELNGILPQHGQKIVQLNVMPTSFNCDALWTSDDSTPTKIVFHFMEDLVPAFITANTFREGVIYDNKVDFDPIQRTGYLYPSPDSEDRTAYNVSGCERITDQDPKWDLSEDGFYHRTSILATATAYTPIDATGARGTTVAFSRMLGIKTAKTEALNAPINTGRGLMDRAEFTHTIQSVGGKSVNNIVLDVELPANLQFSKINYIYCTCEYQYQTTPNGLKVTAAKLLPGHSLVVDYEVTIIMGGYGYMQAKIKSDEIAEEVFFRYGFFVLAQMIYLPSIQFCTPAHPCP